MAPVEAVREVETWGHPLGETLPPDAPNRLLHAMGWSDRFPETVRFLIQERGADPYQVLKKWLSVKRSTLSDWADEFLGRYADLAAVREARSRLMDEGHETDLPQAATQHRAFVRAQSLEKVAPSAASIRSRLRS